MTYAPVELDRAPSRRPGARPMAAVLLAVLLLSATAVVPVLGVARSATPQAGGGANAATPLKAVIIVGPTHGSTASYLVSGENIAKTAASYGMDVRRVFHPKATWANVLANIQGASLVVYLGHGNGWPSPYPPFQTNTKDGMGLNPYEGGSESNVQYYGEGPIATSIKLAPNAVVLLNRLCYASGNGEPGQSIPTASVAVQRVDNFAAGFLAAGARTVFAYGWQSAADIVRGLFTTSGTMDSVFMGSGYTGGADVRFDSVRTPGAKGHLDKTSSGYLRAVSGDLSFTTDAFRGATTTTTSTPVLSSMYALRYNYVLAASSSYPAVFTPNGDGSTESIAVTYTVSVGGSLAVTVTNSAGTVVRTFSVTTSGGSSTFSWNGKSSSGTVVPDGRYTITARPIDRSGKAGIPRSTATQVLTALARASVGQGVLYARDGDNLGATVTLGFQLLKSATVSWRVIDAAGAVVVTNWSSRASAPATYTWSWDGRNAARSYVPDGNYYSLVTATTAAGTVSFKNTVVVGAYRLTRSVSTAAPGTRIVITIVSAEPQRANPVLHIAQPGLTSFTAPTTLLSGNTYQGAFYVRAGGSRGTATVLVTGADTGGGGSSSSTTFSVL